MNKGVVLKRFCVAGVVLLFVLTAVVSSTSKMNEISPLIDENDGTLSGYVTDTFMNPIEGALIRVYFHETYEEDYSDENGYYYVDNIPICWCMKNCTCSKDGYETEWVLLGIVQDTTYDFVLTPLDPVPDLECYGDLVFYNVELGDVLVKTIEVRNVGDPGSLLDWEIESIPDWGCWMFTPDSGDDLLAGEAEDIEVEIIVPDENGYVLDGEVVIVNSENPDDYCEIYVYLHPKPVPVLKNINQLSIYKLFLELMKNM